MEDIPEQLKEDVQAFFHRHRRQVTREACADFLRACADRGYGLGELVFLLSVLVDTRYTWYSTRSHSQGGGRVRAIRFERDTLVVESWHGDEFEYGLERGYRWRTPQGWISRDRIEDALGVWPGYLDAIEDLFRTICERIDALERQDRERRDEYLNSWKEAYESLQKQLALDRHPTLRIWRSRGPNVADEVPMALKSVRHVKRLAESEPCRVYFLVCRGEVVYVGQTAAPWPARILHHIQDKDKEFDDVWYLEVDRPSLSDVEREYIQRFRPRYNRSGLIK